MTSSSPLKKSGFQLLESSLLLNTLKLNLRFKFLIFCLPLLWMGVMPLVHAEDGYRLWLRYDKVNDPALLASYQKEVSAIVVEGPSETEKVLREELKRALGGLLGREIPLVKAPGENGTVVVGSPSTSPLIASLDWSKELEPLGREGYLIRSTSLRGQRAIV